MIQYVHTLFFSIFLPIYSVSLSFSPLFCLFEFFSYPVYLFLHLFTSVRRFILLLLFLVSFLFLFSLCSPSVKKKKMLSSEYSMCKENHSPVSTYTFFSYLYFALSTPPFFLHPITFIILSSISIRTFIALWSPFLFCISQKAVFRSSFTSFVQH